MRWRLAWREVRNRYGEDCRQIAVMQPELTLRAADSDNADYQTVAAIRLTRDSQGHWSQDESFLPPLLNVQASRWLREQSEQLTGQLRARLQRLMSMRRESNERMADFAVADVSLFWLLSALNSAEPLLGHFVRHPQVHPERLYTALAGLAGSLLTFSLEHTTADIPAYRHEQLTAVFPPLFDLLGDCWKPVCHRGWWRLTWFMMNDASAGMPVCTIHDCVKRRIFISRYDRRCR